MAYECFDLNVTEGIAHIRFNRPEKANSMIPAFWTELPAVVNELSRDAACRVIVLSAEGRHFSSGMDISVFTEGGLDGPEMAVDSCARRRLGITVWRCRMRSPVLKKRECPYWLRFRGLR